MKNTPVMKTPQQPAPTAPVTPVNPVAPARANAPAAASKKKLPTIPLIIGGVVILVVVILGILWLLGVFNKKEESAPESVNTAPTISAIRKFCEENNLTDIQGLDASSTSEEFNNEEVKDMLTCQADLSNFDMLKEKAVYALSYVELTKNYDETTDFNLGILSQGATVTATGDNFAVVYGESDYTVGYIVFDHKMVLTIFATDNDAARNALATLGYKKLEQDVQIEEGAEQVSSEPEQKDKGADSSRKAAAIALISAFESFQANNRGELPAIEEGKTTYHNVDGNGGTIADAFYNRYLGAVDELKKSDNERYHFTISTEANQTLAGALEIVVHYNSTCKNDMVVESDAKRDFAVTIFRGDGIEYSCLKKSDDQ